MDKILNGVEALTSKSGLVSIVERLLPTPNVQGDIKCAEKCITKSGKCGGKSHFADHYVTKRSHCRKGPYTYTVHHCSEPC
jgi:hypothetical protein